MLPARCLTSTAMLFDSGSSRAKNCSSVNWEMARSAARLSERSSRVVAAMNSAGMKSLLSRVRGDPFYRLSLEMAGPPRMCLPREFVEMNSGKMKTETGVKHKRMDIRLFPRVGAIVGRSRHQRDALGESG